MNIWVSRFGTFLQIDTEQEANFTSSMFKELYQVLVIDKTQTSTSHPQLNDMVEKFNSTILDNHSLILSRNQSD